MDITWFPFDEQYCSVMFESWMYTVDNVILKVPETGMQWDFEPNGLWEVVGRPLDYYLITL